MAYCSTGPVNTLDSQKQHVLNVLPQCFNTRQLQFWQVFTGSYLYIGYNNLLLTVPEFPVSEEPSRSFAIWHCTMSAV